MAIPNLAEKANGVPLKDDDMLVLNDGQTISVREFVQRLTTTLGSPPDLPYGLLDLGPLEQLTPTISAGTSYTNGILAPNPNGATYITDSAPEGIFYTEASYPLSDRTSITTVAPTQGFVIIALTNQEPLPISTLYNENVNDYVLVGAGVFGGAVQLTFSLNNGETNGNLPAGSLTSPELTFLINVTDDPSIALITLDGISPELFSIPFAFDNFDKLSVISVAGFEPLPSAVPVMVGGVGEFVPPLEWEDGAADGKIYRVVSAGTLFNKRLIVDDFVKMIDQCTDIIPWRFGNFLTRLEVISIISSTVDGYIVSQPVQELLANIVTTQVNALKLDVGEGSLQQFVFDNDFSQQYAQASSRVGFDQTFRLKKSEIINLGVSVFDAAAAALSLEITDDDFTSAAFGLFARGTFKLGVNQNDRQFIVSSPDCTLRWSGLVPDTFDQFSATFTVPANVYTVVAVTCYTDDDTVLLSFEMYQNLTVDGGV